MSIPPFEQPLPPYNASDPSASFLSTSCLELLMIEIVPMAWRVVGDVNGGRNGGEGGGGGGEGEGGSLVGDGGIGGNGEEEEERDAVFYRLEGLGYRVGQGLVE
ncbi:hypothetical protein LCER1_G007495, partial [Lachnellula cervina]